MINRYFLLVLFFLSFSCEEHWDDPIPEGASLGSPYLKSEITKEGEVLLNWDLITICPGFCPPTVEGSSYEVFGKYSEENDFVRIARLGADEKNFLVDNLEYGKPYSFYVTTHRAGQVARSNKVMTIPNPLSEYETLMELDNKDPIYNLKMNVNGNKFAFTSNYRWTDQGKDYMTLSLFLHDMVSGETNLIKLDSYHPQWSADGGKLIFGTTDGLRPMGHGKTSSQLETYNVKTNTFHIVKVGLYQQIFPSFGKEEHSVLFLSDSLESGKMGLWKKDSEGDIQLLWTSFQFPENGAGLSLTTGMNASIFKDMVALDHLSTIENRAVYNIYSVEFGEGVQKKELVGSPWHDKFPVFSPFNEEFLAFLSDRSGTTQVWTLNTSNGNLNQVSFFQDNYYISSSNSLSWIDQGQSLVLPISNSEGIRKLVKISVTQ